MYRNQYERKFLYRVDAKMPGGGLHSPALHVLLSLFPAFQLKLQNSGAPAFRCSSCYSTARVFYDFQPVYFFMDYAILLFITLKCFYSITIKL